MVQFPPSVDGETMQVDICRDTHQSTARICTQYLQQVTHGQLAGRQSTGSALGTAPSALHPDEIDQGEALLLF
jgi:hypothetical protein